MYTDCRGGEPRECKGVHVNPQISGPSPAPEVQLLISWSTWWPFWQVHVWQFCFVQILFDPACLNNFFFTTSLISRFTWWETQKCTNLLANQFTNHNIRWDFVNALLNISCLWVSKAFLNRGHKLCYFHVALVVQLHCYSPELKPSLKTSSRQQQIHRLVFT